MNKVHNRGVIRRVAIGQLKSNKKMSIVVILSIVLTCVLFTTLTVLGGSLVSGGQQEAMRQVGGDLMAGLKYVLPEDYDKVKADGATRNETYRIIVGDAVNQEFKDVMVEIDCAGSVEEAKHTFCNPTTGKLPEGYDEIALSTLVLDALQLPYELGEKVLLELDVDGDILEHEFTLCGYWEGEKLAMAQIGWVSRAFADDVAPTPGISWYESDGGRYAGYWMVDFDYANSWNIEKKTDELQDRLYGDGDFVPQVGINWAYVTSKVDTGTAVGFVVMAFVVFFAGYLIIYNIFYINISTNIQSYGLLKTIGTTSRQIRRMVRTQAAIYCAIGIPVGLVLGLVFGKVFLRSVMENMIVVESEASYALSAKLVVLMCAIAAAFTYETVMVSCKKPCRVAGAVSPLEALRYQEMESGKKRWRKSVAKKRTRKVTPFSMACGNMAKNKRKTVVVALSLTLGMVLVNTFFTVLVGIDMDKFISVLAVGDFSIRPVSMDSHWMEEEWHNVITPSQMEYLEGMDGVSEVNAVRWMGGDIVLEGNAWEKTKKLYDNYYSEGDERTIEMGWTYKDKTWPADVYGVTPGLSKYLTPVQGEIDEEKFASGKYAIVYTQWVQVLDDDSKEDDLYGVGDHFTLKNEDGKSRTYEVMAVCEMPYPLSLQMYGMVYGSVIIPEQEFLELFDIKNVMCAMVNAKEGQFDEVDAQIRALTESEDSEVKVKNKQECIEQYDGFVSMVKLIGGALCGVLALIGILNFSNAVMTGIIVRKREFAMMSAVGMTGRQLKRMLMWEGFWYVLFTAVGSAVLSVALSQTVLKGMAKEMVFFTYHFTVVPILVSVPVLLVISAVIPVAAYRAFCSQSVVERIREE